MAKEKQTQTEPEVAQGTAGEPEKQAQPAAEPVEGAAGAQEDSKTTVTVGEVVGEGFARQAAKALISRPIVTITAPFARRRAGFAFGPTPVHLTEADLDDEKIKALKADPLLSIRPYEPEEAEKE